MCRGPIAVRSRFARPVLACGALLKNTFCIGTGDSAYLGPHIGDLENLETYESFEQADCARGAIPPGQARDRRARSSSRTTCRRLCAVAAASPLKIAVQHHHAHVASAMAEHGLRDRSSASRTTARATAPTGPPGAAKCWSRDTTTFERVATFRPDSACGRRCGHPPSVANRAGTRRRCVRWTARRSTRFRFFSALPAGDVDVVRQMIATRSASPLAHGAGRYFDGIGSLVLEAADDALRGADRARSGT